MNKFIFFLFLLISSVSVIAQKTDSISDKSLNNSIYVDPLLPFFDLLIINYGLKYTNKHEGVFGFVMSKATTTPTKYFEYPGYINAIGANVGHRYYMYKGFHADIWLMPSYNSIYEENENRFYKSFSIYNEYRVGYKIDFELWKVPLLANFQWPIGFSLLDTNKPNSFKEIDMKDPIFYLFIPNIWIGYRF